MFDFWTVFSATLASQSCLWLIDRYIKTRFTTAADQIEQLFKRKTGGKNMARLAIDIEKGSNGGYVVTWYKTLPNTLQKLGGTKAEKQQLAFADSTKLVEWIDTASNYGGI